MVDKLNQAGKSILEYKEELLKPSHSALVKDALLSKTAELLKSEVIDTAVQDALRDEDYSYSAMEALVLEKRNLTKTSEQLLVEYDTLREPFERALLEEEELTDDTLTPIKTESHVEKEEIQIIVEFTANEDFVSNYFNKQGTELETLMKPKGFAEKFIVMRYNALMAAMLKAEDGYHPESEEVTLRSGVKMGATPVFVNREKVLYGCELIIHVDATELEKEEVTEELVTTVKNAIVRANEFVRIRTIV